MAQAENTYTAELSGSGTGEPKPVFSLLVASLAQTVMLLACFWVIAVLFGAGHLLEQVPVYRLYCRPEREAVELAYQTIFGKESTV